MNAAGTNHSTFSDASATALLAASSYRLAQLGLGNSTVPAAAIARANLYSRINSTTGNLLPVVDPLSYTVEGKSSPEGLSFMLILDAAYRDWSDAGGDSIREREPPKAGGSGLPPITSARSGGSKLKLGLFGIFGIGIWILLV